MVARVGSLLCLRACCSASVFAQSGVALSAEYVKDTGISDGASSPRFDVYGHTLHEIDPELSTFKVERQEGQKGQVIFGFSVKTTRGEWAAQSVCFGQDNDIISR